MEASFEYDPSLRPLLRAYERRVKAANADAAFGRVKRHIKTTEPGAD